MLTLRQAVVEVMGGIVLGRTVSAMLVAGQLADGLHAGCTAVDDLHEVEVALALDGDAHADALADVER